MKIWSRLAIAALALAAATGAADAAAVRGGTLTYARYADSLFLDPVLNDANVDIWILTNLYDTLLQPTSDGLGVVPGLATGYKLSDDGKALTLTLRPNTKFADGSPITAADVKWSLDRARNPKNGDWNNLLASIDEITTGGDGVVLKLKHPDPTLLPALATFNAAIMPQKLFEAAPGSTDAEKAKAFAEHPIGSGPFIMTEWQRGTSMTLKRNPFYWQPGEDGKPLPYLDTVRFEVIPDDATRILKLQAGEVDGAEFIPYARVKELQADSRLDMKLFPSTRVAYLTMNVRPSLKDGSPNPLSNGKVRQALNYATDKNGIIQIATFGLGTPMRSFMSSTTPLFYDQGPAYPVNVAKAKQLLTEAGFANGFDVSSLALAGSADDTATLVAIQQMWAQVGVRLHIEQVDNATRTARYRAGDMQMRTSVWTNDISDPSEITSYFAYFPVIESLHSGFRDATLEKQFEASQEETDQAKRGALYKEIQEIYTTAAPIIFLYQTPYPVALRKEVKGFVQIPLGNNVFDTAYVEK